MNSTAARLRALAVLCVVAILMVACGGDTESEASSGGDGDSPGSDNTSEPEPEADAGPEPGGTLVVATMTESPGWSPSHSTLAESGGFTSRAFYEPLLDVTPEGEIVPLLAESFEMSDDLTEVTVKLRSGVEFHDGTPLDAEAVQTMFHDYFLEPTSNDAGALVDLDHVEVVNPLTVNFVLKGSAPGFPDVLTGRTMFSTTAAEEMGPDEFAQTAVGTGPFVLDEWTRDSSLTVVRNEDYWAEGLPYLDSIEFRPIPEEATRLASLQAGDVDMIISSEPRTNLELSDMSDVTVHTLQSNFGDGVMFNTIQPPADDERVRRALTHAFDQVESRELHGGADIVPRRTQYFAESSPWYSEAAAAQYPEFDPDQARELLDEYVNDPDRSDGQPVGSPIEMELMHLPSGPVQDMASYLQRQWSDLGVEASLASQDASTLVSRAAEGDYQSALFRTGTSDDPGVALAGNFGDPEVQVRNFSNFYDDEVAEIHERLGSTADVGERKQAVEDFAMKFTEEMPFAYTGGSVYTLAHHDGFFEVEPNNAQLRLEFGTIWTE